MTETSSSFYNTYPLSHPPPVTAHNSSASPLPNGTYLDPNAVEEEEYTIKCICSYNDDDGNTVYCEQCDTWQHILCYYLDRKKVPDIHFCVECQERHLDAKKATELQRRAREPHEGGDRRAKKPSSKTSKKKQKEAITHEHTNGWTHHERHDSMSNGRDRPPPAKKPKTSHRPSGSVVSVNGESRKRAHSNLQSYPSPSKSPQDSYRSPFIPQYTPEFLELYDRDTGNINAKDNEHTIPASNHLSRWRNDPNMMVRGIEQQPNAQRPFVFLPSGLPENSFPKVTLDTHQKTGIEIDGKHPTWRFLRLQESVKKDTVVGEIRGEIGMLEEYCRQQSTLNRWSELSHPDPFVFFHPHMDIYIDSRKKGTQFRYIRRSCQHNVTLRTLVTETGEVKHCFVAKQDISAGSELTATWYLDPTMFNMNSDREESDQIERQRQDWISRVLANFGDCACGDSSQCPWTRFDRRSSLKSSNATIKQMASRKRKDKSKQAISPTSTGQATNSRAGSEVVKAPDEEDQDDQRSVSDSTPSGPSRDMTPVAVAVLDADPVLGGALTRREMRKIQAAEKAYEKEKQKASDERKKKKRSSGGSTLNTPNPGAAKHFGQLTGFTDLKQSSTSPPPVRLGRDGAGKSTSGARPAKPCRPVYVSVGIQTDPEDCDLDMRALKRVRYITPTQRLLNRIKANRTRCLQSSGQKSSSISPLSSENQHKVLPSSHDVEMKDAGAGISPVASHPSESPELSPTAVKDASPFNMSNFPFPSQAAHTQTNFKAPTLPKLHLSTLPPVPAFPVVGSITPGSTGAAAPLSSPSILSPQMAGAGTILPGPNSSLISPSPAKKKMTLGDYMSRRNLASTPSSEKAPESMFGDVRDESNRKSSIAGSDSQSETPSVQPNTTVWDLAAKSGLEGSAIDDTPIKDEGEGEYSPPDASPAQLESTQPADDSDEHKAETTALTGSLPSMAISGPIPAKEVADVLARLNQFHSPATQL